MPVAQQFVERLARAMDTRTDKKYDNLVLVGTYHRVPHGAEGDFTPAWTEQQEEKFQVGHLAEKLPIAFTTDLVVPVTTNVEIRLGNPNRVNRFPRPIYIDVNRVWPSFAMDDVPREWTGSVARFIFGADEIRAYLERYPTDYWVARWGRENPGSGYARHHEPKPLARPRIRLETIIAEIPFSRSA